MTPPQTDTGNSSSSSDSQAQNSSPTLIVVGAAGYVGSLICHGAATRGIPTIAVTHNPINDSTLLRQPGIAIIRGTEEALGTVGREATVVWLLAGPKHREGQILRELLNADTARNIRKLVYVSSCAVYGKAEEACDEGAPLTPQDAYAQEKVWCEEMVRASKIPWAILRLATLHGLALNNRWNQPVNSLVVAAALCRRIFAYGGASWRPFMSVQDAAAIVLTEAMRDGSPGIYNVAAEHHQFADLHQWLQEMYSAMLIPISKDDARTYRVRTEKMRGLFPDFRGVSTLDSMREMGEWLLKTTSHVPQVHGR